MPGIGYAEWKQFEPNLQRDGRIHFVRLQLQHGEVGHFNLDRFRCRFILQPDALPGQFEYRRGQQRNSRLNRGSSFQPVSKLLCLFHRGL